MALAHQTKKASNRMPFLFACVTRTGIERALKTARCAVFTPVGHSRSCAHNRLGVRRFCTWAYPVKKAPPRGCFFSYFFFTGIFEIALKMPNAAKNMPSTAAASMARRTHTFGAILMRKSMIEPPPSEVPVAR